MSIEVIGFSGVMHSGKTTAAKKLQEAATVPTAHVEFSNAILATASAWMETVPADTAEPTPGPIEALQSKMHEQFGIPLTDEHMADLSLDGLHAYLHRRRTLEPAQREINVRTKEVHRPLLQWLGYQMCTAVNPEFWSDVVGAQIDAHKGEGAQLVTVGGVRFPWDAKMIRGRSGKVVNVIRPGLSAVKTPEEGGLGVKDIDATVRNNGDRERLRAKIDDLWQDIREGYLAREY